MQPGLIVLHANKLESLRDLAVGWIRAHPLAPLENETVLVQSNGMAQWFKFALAKPRSEGGLGICAGVDALMPLRFMWQAYRAVLGEAAVPHELLFDKSRLVWRLVRLLPGLLQDEDFALLRHYLQDDAQGRKRYELALVLADLFDQYQVYRADWLERWAAGRDGEESLAQPWQPKLWRALLGDVPEALRHSSRSAVHARFRQAIVGLEQRPADLPRRVVVFGISSLPAQTLEALALIGSFSQVVLCVLNPCQHYWSDIIDVREQQRARFRRQTYKPGHHEALDTVALHADVNPLLAAWGKQGRDYVRLLDEFDDSEQYRARVSATLGHIDLFEPYVTEPPGTTLQQLQQAILELSAKAPEELDDSVVFHVAHSPQREVEILHDQLLARLDADPELKPSDIMVMVPDITVYAPVIRAVFGRLQPVDSNYIPFTLADQDEGGEQVLRTAINSLLALPQARLTLEEGLDLLEVPALARRFGLTDAEVDQLHDWLRDANVRWGLNAAQRGQLGMPAELEQNTWIFGLQRLLLGYAAGGDSLWQNVAGLDGPSGLTAETLGALAEFLRALERLLAQLAQPHTPDQWAELLRVMLERFFLPDDAESGWFERLGRQIEDWRQDCAISQLREPLSLAVVRQAVFAALDAPRLSQRFFGAGVHFSTLMPMRAIPFKMVCLLGMNDGDYPRQQPAVSFDLMRGRVLPGDRSRRDDDQYLFLEALLSARRYLYLSWVGRSVRDNSEQPPSVLLARLLDFMGAQERVVHHPLQPYDARYFRDAPLFSYDAGWRALHDGMADDAAGPLSRLAPPGSITLDNLQRFVQQPVDAFFAQRLRVRFPQLDEGLEDDESFGLTGLQKYAMGRQLIESVTASNAGTGDAAWQRAGLRLQLEGALPMGAFGEEALAQLLSPAKQVAKRITQWQERYPLTLPPQEVQLDLQSLRLEDWLHDLRQASRDAQGDQVGYLLVGWQPLALFKNGKPAWHKLLPLWLSHLAGCAMGLPLTSVMLAADRELVLKPLAQSEAQTVLQALAAAWLEGMQAPLPVACKSAFAYLNTQAALKPDEDEEKAWSAARAIYEGNDANVQRSEPERSAALRKLYPRFDLLPREDFARWAGILYGPLLQHIGVQSRHDGEERE